VYGWGHLEPECRDIGFWRSISQSGNYLIILLQVICQDYPLALSEEELLLNLDYSFPNWVINLARIGNYGCDIAWVPHQKSNF
jgi:hypothetical protein